MTKPTCYGLGCEFIERFNDSRLVRGKTMKIKKQTTSVRGVIIDSVFLDPDDPSVNRKVGSFIRHHNHYEGEF